MKTVLLSLLTVLIVIVAVVFGTLARNQARLFQAPGFAERLSVYLNQHVAETSDNHAFPELRTPVFEVDADSLFSKVLEAVDSLGWQLQHSDEENLSANIVVASPLLGFKDDLSVQVKMLNNRVDGESSALLIRSSSRVGKGDLAANAGHIQTLVDAVDYRLREAALKLYQAD